MGGGLMQLVAYGAQDIYLTGNPQITFFKVVYRRHTNFSMEAIQQTFNGAVGTGSSTITATISRNGDLVGRLWLEVKLSSTGLKVTTNASHSYINWCNNTGHAFVKQCEVEIGGQMIDRHYSQWLDVWNELTDHDESEWVGLNKHSAQNAYLLSNIASAATTMGTMDNQKLYIPLQFWFCRNPGLALPLIALQYHEVKVKLVTRPVNALINTDNISAASNVLITGAPTVQLWADYIYLDTDERRRFAQVSHEYLIEQVQRQTGTIATSNKLNFNHPVKLLVWTNQSAKSGFGETLYSTGTNTGLDVVTRNSPNTDGIASVMTGGNDYFNYTQSTTYGEEVIYGAKSNEAFTKMNLQLNGHDRFAKRDATYFRTCQPFQAGLKVPSKHIYCYSFALKPEEHQPSGTCNFSRIDNAQIILTETTALAGNLTVYAVNYNVLRIMSGMGGLAYSN